MTKIYSSLKEVERDLGYVKQRMEEASKTAITYIKDVVREIGAVNIELSGVPVLLVYKRGEQAGETIGEGMVMLYETIANPINIQTYSLETLCKIASEIHALHLVKEWREDEESCPVSSDDEQSEK